MCVAEYLQDLRLAGGDPELKRIAYAAFRERETANRNERFVAAVARGLPKGQGRSDGYSSWDKYDQGGKEVSLKEALQRAGIGNGENVQICAWSKSEEDELKA
jgi:hypothetical protein